MPLVQDDSQDEQSQNQAEDAPIEQSRTQEEDEEMDEIYQNPESVNSDSNSL